MTRRRPTAAYVTAQRSTVAVAASGATNVGGKSRTFTDRRRQASRNACRRKGRYRDW